MVVALKILQSDLKTREATVDEKIEMDRRIVEDKPLFDDEPDQKEPDKPGEPEKPEEETPEAKKKREEDERQLSDEDLLEAKDDDLNDDQKSRKSDLTKAKAVLDKEAEDKKVLEAKEEDLNEAQKARKAELVKVKDEEGSEEGRKKAFDAEVKAYMAETEVSEEAARKDLESIGKIVENFKGDPKKLAKSHLHMQRLQARTTDELKAAKERSEQAAMPEITIKSLTEMVEKGELKSKGKPVTREDMIERYRDQNSDAAEGLEDEVVFRMACQHLKGHIEGVRRDSVSQVGVQAVEKRTKLMAGLSAEDKKFLPQIKVVMKNYADSYVMTDEFDIENTIRWARGEKKLFSTAVKDAEERGFKRGTEARKILGEIKQPGEGSGTKPKKGPGTNKSTLSDAEKRRAEETFENNNIPLDRKYELYAEILEHEKQLTESQKEKK